MSIITIENTDIKVDSEDIIYSKGYSRPSKSILDPELYSKYKSIKDSFNLFEDLKSNLLLECLNYIFSCVVNINENLYTLDSLCYKLVSFYESKFNNITQELNNKYTNYIIVLNDIYNYPKIQYIYILSSYFKKIDIIMSKISNFIVIICHNRLKLIDFKFKKEFFVKDFNIKVEENIIKFLKQDNNGYFSNIINLNDKVTKMCQSLSQISNLNREMFTISKYYRALINKECNIHCSCRPNYIFYSDLLECYICENCLILTRFLTF